jgi:uncharacterized protein (TIGR02246 family)
VRKALTILACTFLAACQPSQELTDDQELALIDSVLHVQGDMMAAARAVDADRFLGFFAADAAIVIDGVVAPRELFAADMRAAYQQLDRQEINWHPAHVAVISRDAVVLTIGGRYHAVGPTGETVWSGQTTWTEIFERHPDGWKLTYAHQSPVPSNAAN